MSTNYFHLAQSICYGYGASEREESYECPYCTENAIVRIVSELGSGDVTVLQACSHFEFYREPIWHAEGGLQPINNYVGPETERDDEATP